MMLEMHAVVQSVNIVLDLMKAGYSVRNANEIATAVFDVLAKLTVAQAAVLASQEKQATLTQRIGDLEKEIVELKNWERERERYQLTTLTSGAHARSLKPGMEQGEPPHLLCTNCFEDNKKSILQPHRRTTTGTPQDCPRCKVRIYSEFYRESSGGMIPLKSRWEGY